MRASWTKNFRDSFIEAPPNIQQSFEKQLKFLLQNIRHPSLKTKKYDETQNIWQARASRSWRFYFTIEKDNYILLDLISHPK